MFAFLELFKRHFQLRATSSPVACGAVALLKHFSYVPAVLGSFGSTGAAHGGGEHPPASSTAVSLLRRGTRRLVLPPARPQQRTGPTGPQELGEHLSCWRLHLGGAWEPSARAVSPPHPLPPSPALRHSGTAARSLIFFFFLFISFFLLLGGCGEEGGGELHLSTWVLGNKTLQKAVSGAAGTSPRGGVG